jgi:hypothetical protein
MAWNPTNANDVTLIVSRVLRDDSGARSGTSEIANTGAVVVDDFSIDTEEDLEGLSGIGNRTPQGISKGDVDHSFSFTVQGEDGALFQQIAEGEDGEADSGTQSRELEITARFESIDIELSGAWAGTRNVSGSSGDAIEYEVEGMATNKETVTP